ncbi:MAG: cbb3-type cytochrome oxidase assembly protein CcoS [Candidatus Competibacterales bacterium]
MSILFLLIPIALVLLAVALMGFIWAVRTQQFDDLQGPAHRILMDDDDPRIPDYQREDTKAPPGDGDGESTP